MQHYLDNFLMSLIVDFQCEPREPNFHVVSFLIIYIDPTDGSEGTKNSKLNVNVNNILKTPTGIRFIL